MQKDDNSQFRRTMDSWGGKPNPEIEKETGSMQVIENIHITTLHCPHCQGKAMYVANLLSRSAVDREKRRHRLCSYLYAKRTGKRSLLFWSMVLCCLIVAVVLIYQLLAFFFFGSSL